MALSGSALASEGCRVNMSPEYLSNIILDPEAEFRALPKDDIAFMYSFRALSVNGTGALRAIGAMVPHGSPRQKGLIGQGLARSVAACNARYGVIAGQIVDAVRDIADRDVTRAFTRFLTDSSADAAAADPATTVAKTDLPAHKLKLGDIPDSLRPVTELSPIMGDPFRQD